MKKTFSINIPNKKPERQVDAIKHEIKKYLTRERKKELPANTDFWDFDCKIGASAGASKKILVQEINKNIGQLFTEGNESIYLEILAKPGFKTPKS